jgi:hypothetical protein
MEYNSNKDMEEETSADKLIQKNRKIKYYITPKDASRTAILTKSTKTKT